MSAAPVAPPRLAVIRYMGNKAALLPVLLPELHEAAEPGALVVDPMAGSHAVTHALKSRHPLVASDAQEYSAVLGRAFVANTTIERLAARDAEAWREEALRRTDGEGRGFLEETYSDTYLGRAQCRALDALRAAADALFAARGDPRRDLALAALFAAACRAQASPGHFAQYLPPDHARTVRLRGTDLMRVAPELATSFRVAPGVPGSAVFALPWRELVVREGARLAEARAWYLDPPYTADQYSRFYHLLETLARGDRPRLDEGKGRYRSDRFRSAFSLRAHAARELRELLLAVRDASPRARVVLSYSSQGLLSLDALREATRGAWREERFREVPHVYSTQGRGRLAGVREWVLTLAPA